jgi:small subunit ribosomal protein S2
VVADAVAEGLVARSAAAANAGRDEKPAEGAAPSGQLAEDEPMPEWERDLLQPTGATGEAGAEAPTTPSA